MHTGFFLTLLACLPAVISATPTASKSTSTIALSRRAESVTDDGVVRREFVRNQLTRAVSNIRRGFAAYERNTGVSHEGLTRRLEQRAQGSIPLIKDTIPLRVGDLDGAIWQGNVLVGTPPVSFSVIFDTGSTDTFLPSSVCTNCQGHKLYDTNASSTAQSTNQPFNITFEGSSTVGTIFTDVVSAGGLKATNQSVGSATQYSAEFTFQNSPPDGLMGFAFKEISTFGSNSFFQNLVDQNRTSSSVFGVKLAKSGSELTLGGVNNKLFRGPFTQVPVTQPGFWTITVDSFNVKGRAVTKSAPAIIASGVTLIMGGNLESVQQFYAAIPGSRNASDTVGENFYTVPCKSIPKTISLTFGGKAFPFSAETFNLGQVAPNSCDCLGAVAFAPGLPTDGWIISDAFMQNVYTSFDVTKKSVGFANLA